MKITYLVPHFPPDIAPTGLIAAGLVDEWAASGHTIEVITSLPWYREHKVEPGYAGHLVRREDAPWGQITRIHPLPTSDKTSVARRSLSFGAFSALAATIGARGTADVVLGMAPPLTLGPAAWTIAKMRRAPFVFNVQDIWPDVAAQIGVVENRFVISAARRLERWCYARADRITVLSGDLRVNVAAKVENPEKVQVIPNFVDTEAITPVDADNDYRREFGLTGKTVVMYAGNVGLSQSLDMVVEAASALAYEEDLVFVVNGNGSTRARLEDRARGLANVRFIDFQPPERLPDVLAAADIHLVPLKGGLARSSFPSKVYSILAAGRPLIASVDAGSDIDSVIDRAGAGIIAPPDDAEALTKAIRRLLDAPEEARDMGARGRKYAERHASRRAVARAYEESFRALAI